MKRFARVGDQIKRKMEKLIRYKADAQTTVLILETRDSALMNQYKMLDAARTSVAGKMPDGLDCLWYAEAGGHVFLDVTNPSTNGADAIE
jgi:hypothetical protein